MAANIAADQLHILISRAKTPENMVIYGFPDFIKHAAEERNLDIQLQGDRSFQIPNKITLSLLNNILEALKRSYFFAAKLRPRPLPTPP